MKRPTLRGKKAKRVTVDDSKFGVDYEIVDDEKVRLARENGILRHDCDALREELYRRTQEIAAIVARPTTEEAAEEARQAAIKSARPPAALARGLLLAKLATALLEEATEEMLRRAGISLDEARGGWE